MKAIVKIPEKKAKYRIIEAEGKKYLIDTEEHKLSYIFPMMNWFIPKKAKELTDDELEALKPQKILNKEEKKERNRLAWGAGGSGTALYAATRDYDKYFDVQVSYILSIFVFWAIIILALAIRMYASIRMKDKKINFKSYDYKIVYIPRFKTALGILSIYAFFMCVTFGTISLFFHKGIDNLIITVAYLLALLFPLFSNIFFILPGEAKVKIKKSK